MSRFRQLVTEAEEKIFRDALAEHGSITQAAMWLEVHRNWMSRKLMALGVTESELNAYRAAKGKGKYGTGWSGKHNGNGREDPR